MLRVGDESTDVQTTVQVGGTPTVSVPLKPSPARDTLRKLPRAPDHWMTIPFAFVFGLGGLYEYGGRKPTSRVRESGKYIWNVKARSGVVQTLP